MNISRWRLLVFLGPLVLGDPCLVQAQDADTTAVLDAPTGLGAEISAARTAIEGSSLDDPFKASALKAVGKASDLLKQAQDFAARTTELRKETEEAPQEIDALKAQLAAPPMDPARVVIDSATELQELLQTERAALAALQVEVDDAKRGLMDLEARPVQVSTRLPVANTELAQARAKLAALGDAEEESLPDTAARLSLKAAVESLQAEVAMLEQEQLGQSQRESVAKFRKELAERSLEEKQARVEALEQKTNTRLKGELDQLEATIASLGEKVKGGDEELKDLVEELREMVDVMVRHKGKLDGVRERLESTERRLATIKRESERVRREMELGRVEGASARLVLNQARRLPARAGLDFELDGIDGEIAEAQLWGFHLDEKEEAQQGLEEAWDGDPQAEAILELRSNLVERLSRAQRDLLQNLAKLSAEQTAYRDLVVDFSKFLNEEMFWRRSSEPIGPEFFRDLPMAVSWAIAPSRWPTLINSMMQIPGRHPVSLTGVLLGLFGLVATRRILKRTIEQSSTQIRRISTDRFSHTLKAFFASLLLALPVPLVLWFVGWALKSEPSAETWIRGLSAWLGWAAASLMWIFSMRVMAAEGGIGRTHFGWYPDSSEMMRKAAALIPFFYLPALLVASLTVFEEDARYFDSLGRLGVIVAEIGIAAVFLKMFRPNDGVLASMIQAHPKWLISRGAWVWFGLLIGLPVALGLMAVAGYTITALALSEQFLVSIRVVAAGFVGYGLLLRWFMIRQRRIALNEAIRQRKIRRELAEKGGERPDDKLAGDDDDVSMDLDAVAQQTRHLLRSLIGIAVLVVIWFSVESALPIRQAASVISIDGRITGLGLLQALLIGLITFTMVRNLPGILDLGGMRESGVSPGSRYAIATLCQYAVGAIGILLVTQALAIDWSRLGWIAAALSVGLGFGLQEVVANFVCGIIILFERPVRVGDVVTVGQVTGTISRIRMRATTITNWDRQEFVVPNKDFITGSLINWTLSNPINRLTIEVGVAYGSDTVRAREILTAVAEEHPVVLEDPAPLVTFDQFADSTLNLTMRVYLPDMENRLLIRTELLEQIDIRFKEAGLEIAFPQRDLHIRSVPDDLIRGRVDSKDEASDDNS